MHGQALLEIPPEQKSVGLEGKRTLSTADSQLLFLSATLVQAGPAHFILTSSPMIAETLCDIRHSWLM